MILQNDDPGATEGVTVTVDPSQSDAVELNEPQAEPEAVTGPVSSAIDSAVPETGVETIDTSVSTLSDSLGGLVDSFVAFLPQLVIAAILILVTALLASYFANVARRVSKRVRLKANLQDLLGKFIYIGVWFFGIIAAAGVVFPGLGMGELVATAGLASIAVGLAFQDIFENLMAGILIIWRFPFNDGDFIEIPSEGVQGKVIETQIRMTMIRSVSGELILVPNATIYKNVVRVLTNKPIRRMTVMCGIAYGEDIASGRRVIREAVEGCETVCRDQPIEIFANGFGASSMDFEITWWTGATPVEQRESRDEVIEKVKTALDRAGIEIPYPYRTLTFSPNEPEIIRAIRSSRADSSGDGEGSSSR